MKKLVFIAIIASLAMTGCTQKESEKKEGKRNPLFPRQLGRSGGFGQKGKEKDLYRFLYRMVRSLPQHGPDGFSITGGRRSIQ